MAFKFLILAAALSACQAVPVRNDMYPNAMLREGRSPSVSFGFGSGFSSDIGGIRQSNSYGTAFQSGNSNAYGAGYAGRDYASSVGIAQALPQRVVSQPIIQPATQQLNRPVLQQVNYAVPTQNFGSAISSTQNNNGFASATSSATNGGWGRYQNAVSSAQNNGLGYESAVAAANSNGFGQGSAVSSAQNLGNFGSAVSSAQSLNGYNNYGASVAAAENFGNYKASTAQTIQQNGRRIQESGATSVNAPGVQAANSHAVNFY